ncbi:hypothetical protein BAE44_0021104, partial [Dichanthelium oligosanthes]
LLEGLWAHQNPELGNLVVAVPGFLSVVAAHAIPQELSRASDRPPSSSSSPTPTAARPSSSSTATNPTTSSWASSHLSNPTPTSSSSRPRPTRIQSPPPPRTSSPGSPLAIAAACSTPTSPPAASRSRPTLSQPRSSRAWRRTSRCSRRDGRQRCACTGRPAGAWCARRRSRDDSSKPRRRQRTAPKLQLGYMPVQGCFGPSLDILIGWPRRLLDFPSPRSKSRDAATCLPIRRPPPRTRPWF